MREPEKWKPKERDHCEERSDEAPLAQRGQACSSDPIFARITASAVVLLEAECAFQCHVTELLERTGDDRPHRRSG